MDFTLEAVPGQDGKYRLVIGETVYGYVWPSAHKRGWKMSYTPEVDKLMDTREAAVAGLMGLITALLAPAAPQEGETKESKVFIPFKVPVTMDAIAATVTADTNEIVQEIVRRSKWLLDIRTPLEAQEMWKHLFAASRGPYPPRRLSTLKKYLVAFHEKMEG